MSNHIDPKVKVQEIRDRHAAATPGPWYWHGYLKSQDVDLMSETSGHPTVMGFRRWGMNGAAPSFNVDGVMERIDYGMIETRKRHSSDFHKIKHPDADLIKHSWADIAYLLSQVERLQTIVETQGKLIDSYQRIGMDMESDYADVLERIKQNEMQTYGEETGTYHIADSALSHLKGE